MLVDPPPADPDTRVFVVDDHSVRAHILAELDLRSRTQAALRAVREGLAPAPGA